MIYDCVIVGAGPAGYPCAIRCAQNRLKVLIIERSIAHQGTKV